MNSNGFEFSFAWLFAMIVGGAILVLAVFLATNIIKTSELQTATTSAAELGVLLNPIETSLEEGKTYTIHFPQDTRIINRCFIDGTFGRQEISISTQSISGGWSKPGVPSVFYNKYVFSSSQIEGKDIALFTQPLNLPFKIGDIIIASTDSYCFVNPPDEIRDEISSFGLNYFNSSSNLRGCPQKSISVCFSNTNGCSIIVDTRLKVVKKDKKVISYDGPLLYAAIVADPVIYQCEVQRLLKRTTELSYIYIDKAALLLQHGCGVGLESDLRTYITLLSRNVSLGDVRFTADTLAHTNEALTCKLF